MRGLGRAYGDANLPAATTDVVATSLADDRILAFDPGAPALRVEAGLSLAAANRFLWPRGLAVPVSPGTQQVTFGGMVAADVHGKNHHLAGTIGRHVRTLRLALANGSTVEVSRELDPELFRATLGGMGLTGAILEVELDLERIESAWIRGETSRHGSFEELCAGLVEAGRRWPMTAAWLDATNTTVWGRGVVLAGRWATAAEAPAQPPGIGPEVAVFLEAPGLLLNDLSIGLFDRAYWWRAPSRARVATVHPRSFFYPLDAVADWNHLYGRRGFVQYQCVIPQHQGVAGAAAVLDRLRALGGRAYLVVLKDFGAEGEGLLSFPRPGFTLALDLPRDHRTVAVARGLDEVVLELGGRLYLAKDALLDAATFRAMEGDRLERFLEVKRRVDPQNRWRSAQALRLGLAG